MYISEGVTPCQEWPTEWWFAKPGSTLEAKAKEWCLTCPERMPCLDSTLRFERRTQTVQPATLGGMTEYERARLLRSPLAVPA